MKMNLPTFCTALESEQQMNADVKNKVICTSLYNAAISLIESRNLSGAVVVLNQALELAGDNPQYLNMLGLCLYARGSFKQARECFVKSREIDSTSINARRYIKSMDLKEFGIYVETFNSCVEAVKKNKPVKALFKLLPALESVPNAQGFNLAGLLYYKLGMRKNAARYWMKSFKIDLSDKTAAYYLSNCKEGFLPITFEKILWGVFCLAGKLKLL